MRKKDGSTLLEIKFATVLWQSNSVLYTVRRFQVIVRNYYMQE
jgi:hypothetical protein